MKKSNLKYLLALPALLLIASCASIGNPSGGPRDENPPRFVRANPAPGAVNFNGNKIDIWFDEYINVKDPLTKVIVSPPGAQTPRVAALGKHLSVTFPDSLRPNTTYTIDFGNAIEDNNEQNKLSNFSYSFSTGSSIDSLRISGMVLSADNLEPQQGKLVGIHSNLNDSAFKKLRFDRVARTDDRGRFSIMGVSPGEYRLFMLDDLDNDMRWSSPEESLAFHDVIVSPFTAEGVANDTVFNPQTGAVDSVRQRLRTIFLPNNILLRSFSSAFKQQYLGKYERRDTTKLYFEFNSAAKDAPEFSIIGAPNLKNWYIRESSPTNDTITLWLKSRGLIAADTLRVVANYLRTDSAMQLSPYQDTLRFVFDRKKHDRLAAQALKDNRKKLKTAVDSAEFFRTPNLSVNFDTHGIQEVNLPIRFETETPLSELKREMFHLEQFIDSVWTPVDAPVVEMPDSLRPRNFRLSYPWEYETKYRLKVDSAAMTGIYGLLSAPISSEFETRSEKDYSTLKFTITGLDPEIPAFVQLLQNDNPVRSAKVVDGKVEFPFLQPSKYYVRLYEDFNGNGIYDPGDYNKGTQPDLVYYYPKVITLKKNWDKEQTWNVFETPVNLQKPAAILQNRPETNHNQPQQPQEEEEEED